MRNIYLSFFALALCLVLVFCTLSACSKSEPDNNSSETSSLDSTDNVSSNNEVDQNQNGENESVPLTSTDDYFDYNNNNDYEDSEVSEDGTLSDCINIKNASTPVMTDYLGLNAIYHGYMYIPDSDGRMYTEKQALTEYSRVKQMGLDTVRTYYGSEFAYNSVTDSLNFESDAMKGFYRWLKEMQDAGIDISLNAAWSIKGLFDNSHWASWDGLFVENDINATAKNYTDWMVESLKQFRARGINNVKYLIMFTEPDVGGFRYKDRSDSDIEDLVEPDFDEWLIAVKALDGGLKAANMRSDYKMVGPNSTGYTITKSGSYINPMFYQAIKHANDYIDIYSNHAYLNNIPDATADVVSLITDVQWKEFADYTKSITGKDYWIDEYNVAFGAQDALYQSRLSPWQALHHAVSLSKGMNMGIKNQMMWTLADQQWPNNHTGQGVNDNPNNFLNGVQCHGILPCLFETSIPRISYYGISLLTKYFGNNGTVYETVTDDMTYTYGGAQQGKDGVWSILAVNMELTDDVKMSFEFEKGIGRTVFYRHLYNANSQVATVDAKLIGIDKVIVSDGNAFIDNIPSGCIAVYTTKKY